MSIKLTSFRTPPKHKQAKDPDAQHFCTICIEPLNPQGSEGPPKSSS